MLAYVEDTVNNVNVDDGHTDVHLDNVDDGHTDGHADACTWSDVVSKGTIGGRNVHICTYWTAYKRFEKNES